MRDRLLSEGMRFEDQDIPVTRDAENVTVLYLRDLPYEVASDDVIDFFSTYGEVLTVERSVVADFPNLCNGNRIVEMVLNEELPYFISICGCQSRLWYRGQLIQCIVCREFGHRAQSCPLSTVVAAFVTSPGIWPESVHEPGSQILCSFCRCQSSSC